MAIVTADKSAVSASILLAPIISASLGLLPIYVGGLITHNGLSLQNALNIVSLEMWGMALSVLPAIFLMKRFSSRKITFVSLALMIVAFALPSIFNLSFKPLAAVRFMGGLGAGVAMAVTMATIGQASKPDKAFSLWVLAQVVFKVIGIFIVSRLLVKFGMNGFFVPLLILCVLAFPLANKLPDEVKTDSTERRRFNWSIQPVLALLGVFVFYVGISAIWANFERIGHWAGFETLMIGNILSFTSLAALAGAACATLLAGRLNRGILLLAGLVLISGATFSLGLFSSITVYSIIGLVFAFAWMLTVPFLIASVNSNDETGGLMVFTNSAIAIGLALGPAIAGVLIKGEHYNLLTVSAALGFMAVLAFLLPSNKKA
ncbi:MAG: MFS transporter [Litorimonas sp.]